MVYCNTHSRIPDFSRGQLAIVPTGVFHKRRCRRVGSPRRPWPLLSAAGGSKKAFVSSYMCIITVIDHLDGRILSSQQTPRIRSSIAQWITLLHLRQLLVKLKTTWRTRKGRLILKSAMPGPFFGRNVRSYSTRDES